MANPVMKRSGLARRLTALCLTGAVLAGCTQTTTNVRALPGPATQHLRLTRAGVTPVSGSFRQEGHSIVGQLSFISGCTLESRQLVRRRETSETRANPGASVALTVVGGAIAVLGVGLLVASGDADDRVSCGEGRAGDRCQSESSALVEAGFTSLVSGLALGVSGGYLLAAKPQTETKELPAETQAHLLASDVPCGQASALEGLSVALDLPHGGRWSGRAEADGSVRIDVSENIQLPDRTTLPIVVESVPPVLAGVVSPGTQLGELNLTRSAASKNRPRAKEARDPLASRR